MGRGSIPSQPTNIWRIYAESNIKEFVEREHAAHVV